jgi:p-hydroxybenzoate 3-monooxygenase
LAHLLGQASIPFVVVERQDDASLGRHPKAGLIEYRTVQQLGQAGIAGSVLDFIVRNHQCEFRTPAGSAMLDYGALTGGRSHYLYPQHQLVRRLADHLVAGGGQVRFGHTVQRVSAGPAGAVVTVTGPGGRHSEIGCEVVVGCDGARSTVAAAMPGLRVAARALPVRWLSVVAQAPPLAGHTIYGSHPRGFAGQMRRGPGQTGSTSRSRSPTRWPAGRSSGSAMSCRCGCWSPAAWATARRSATSAASTCGSGRPSRCSRAGCSWLGTPRT